MVEIGSSDAPVILGCSPHSTPWRLWAEKVGLLERKDEPSEQMSWGTALERSVLDRFAETRGLAGYVCPQPTEYHEERLWQRATPDGVVYDEYGPRVLIEVKCTVSQPPPVPRVSWVCQCLHQQLVFEQAREHYLVAFGALRMEVWKLPYHRRALDRVLREEERFLNMVEREDPPPVSGRDASVLNRAWPLLSDVPVRLGPDAMQWDLCLVESKRQMAAWKEIADEATAHLKDALGPATKGVLPDGTTYSYLPQSVQEHVVKASTTRVLRRKGE